jgi:microcystin-dependent protein
MNPAPKAKTEEHRIVSQPFLGQIEAFSFNLVPSGWLPCQGQLLAINRYQALFSLMGTNFGGDGRTTFALPDLRGRVAMGQGAGGQGAGGQGAGSGLTPRAIGQGIGEEGHTILLAEMPVHNHLLNTTPNADVASNVDIPGGTVVLGSATATQNNQSISINPYAPVPPVPNTALAPGAIAMNNGGQAHSNMMGFVALQFCIATSGIFPSRD